MKIKMSFAELCQGLPEDPGASLNQPYSDCTEGSTERTFSNLCVAREVFFVGSACLGRRSLRHSSAMPLACGWYCHSFESFGPVLRIQQREARLLAFDENPDYRRLEAVHTRRSHCLQNEAQVLRRVPSRPKATCAGSSRVYIIVLALVGRSRHSQSTAWQSIR